MVAPVRQTDPVFNSSSAPAEPGEAHEERHRAREWLGRWTPRAYIAAAIALIPWDTYLALSLPQRQISPHYRGSWVVYDAVLCVVLARIGWLILKRDTRVVLAAAAGAALLFADAWFDVSSAYGNDDHFQALMFAIFLELPGAYLCARIASRALKRIAERGMEPPESTSLPTPQESEPR